MEEQQRKRRAVVLEDEAMILIDIQEQLEQMGFEVTACLGDAEAATAIAAGPVDLVLLNLGLDDGRRAGLVEAARARDIAVVVTSGTPPLGGKPGDAVFLPKPFSTQDLVDAVTQAVLD